MNQILSTSMPVNDKRKKVKNNGPIAISGVIKVFGIIMLITVTTTSLGIYFFIFRQNSNAANSTNIYLVVQMRV